MAAYALVLKDGEVEWIDGADTYEQEGPLTTFFRTAPDRQVVDCWSTRLLSIRTAEIVCIRRAQGESSGIESAQRRGLEIADPVG